MTHPKQITDCDLNAYVDGELDRDSCSSVVDWLRNHPGDRAKVAAYQAQNAALHGLFDDVLEEPVPFELAQTMAERPVRAGLPVWAQLVAAVVLVMVGAVGGWGLRGGGVLPAETPAYVQRAVGAHLVYAAEVLHPVEVRADQQDHLVGWLSKRLGAPLKAPYLGELGYSLIGGRLLAEEAKPAAQFMYEDTKGRRVTVYLRLGDGKDTAFKFYGSDAASAFYWVDGPFAYALSGDISRSELMDIAHVVYREEAS
jgi:anti-sigma factor RsiW